MMGLSLALVVIAAISCAAFEYESEEFPEIAAEKGPLGKKMEKNKKHVEDLMRFPLFIPTAHSASNHHVGKRCKTNHDCFEDECCIFRRKNELKICRKMLLSGSRCNPFLKPGLSAMCSCAPGLTCSLSSSRHGESRAVFKCAEVFIEPSELEYDE